MTNLQLMNITMLYHNEGRHIDSGQISGKHLAVWILEYEPAYK